MVEHDRSPAMVGEVTFADGIEHLPALRTAEVVRQSHEAVSAREVEKLKMVAERTTGE